VTSGVTAREAMKDSVAHRSDRHLSEIGFEIAGRRLAGLASRASFALGDPGRIRIVGANETRSSCVRVQAYKKDPARPSPVEAGWHFKRHFRR